MDELAGLRGRDAELSTLHALVGRALHTGAGAVAVVRGAPGIGKTRLLQGAAARARPLGVRVAVGGADELDGVTPLGPLLLALRSGDPPLLDVPRLADLGPVLDQRLLLLEQVVEVLQQGSAGGPVLVALDDLQWADPATLFVLRHLPGRLASSPVVLVLAARDRAPDAVEVVLTRLRAEGATQVSLRPLPDDELEGLVSDAVGPLPPRLRTVLPRAEGNPLVALLLAEEPADDGAPLPDGLRSALTAPVRRLSRPAVQLLGVGAVLGREFALSDATALLGWSVSSHLDVLDEVLRSDLVDYVPTGLRFRHDLLRQAVYDDLPRPVRAALHREAARLMLDSGRDLLLAVPHLRLGAEPGDAAAAGHLMAAAGTLVTTSAPQAAALVRDALDLLPAGEARRELLGPAVPMLAYGGLLDRARALAAEVDLGQETGAQLAVATAEFLQGTWDLSLDRVRGVLARGDLAPAEEAAALGTGLMVSMSRPTLSAEDRRWCARAEQLLPGLTDPAVRLAAAGGVALVHLCAGDAGRVLALLDPVAPLWEQVPPALRGARALRMMALQYLDRFDEAERQLGIGLREAESAGLGLQGEVYRVSRSMLAGLRGDLDTAQAEAETVLRVGFELDEHSNDVSAYGALARACWWAGDEPGATRAVEQALAVHRDGLAGDWSFTSSGAVGDVLAALGRREEALVLLAGCFDADFLVVNRFPLTAPLEAPGLGRLARAWGQEDRLTALEARTADFARRCGSASATAGALHVQGLLRRDAEPLRAALDVLGADVPRPLAAARAALLADLGRQRAADGAPEEGADRLDEAWETWARLGRVDQQLQVQRDLRRLGRRRRGWVTRPAAPRTGWASLTPAEQRVAALAAQGETNRGIAERLVLSPHTVNTHLGRVFGKLEVRSRVQLARAVAGQVEPADLGPRR